MAIITAYLTTHSLKKGVIEHSAVKKSDDYEMVLKGGEEYHLTEESARARVEEMRKKKIESLKKQIAKLENMKFEVKKV